MIEETYVNFETAKLLKKKGFDEKCQKVYMHNGQLLWAQVFMEGESFVDDKCIEAVANYNDWISHTQSEYAYLCPTLQMVMKWLRDTFHLEIYPFHDAIQENNDWWYRVEHHSKGCSLTEHESDVIYKTYEQACEAAIKYCLENLI